MWGFIVALISGALMSIQGVFNTEVTKQTSLWVWNLGTIKDEIADSRVRFVKGDIRNAELVANIFASYQIKVRQLVKKSNVPDLRQQQPS